MNYINKISKKVLFALGRIYDTNHLQLIYKIYQSNLVNLYILYGYVLDSEYFIGALISGFRDHFQQRKRKRTWFNRLHISYISEHLKLMVDINEIIIVTYIEFKLFKKIYLNKEKLFFFFFNGKFSISIKQLKQFVLKRNLNLF